MNTTDSNHKIMLLLQLSTTEKMKKKTVNENLLQKLKVKRTHSILITNTREWAFPKVIMGSCTVRIINLISLTPSDC